MDMTLRQKLRNMVSGKILFDEPMSRHTSMGVGGIADAVVWPERTEELSRIIRFLRQFQIPFIPIGNGTNLIVKDGGYNGTVISMLGLNSISLTERGHEQVLLHAGAGATLSEIVLLTEKRSLSGMEFCAGIPGSVGGAVKMNAGAWGNEIKNIVETVELMIKSGEILESKKDDLKFTYRNLDIAEGTIIVGASFLLARGIDEKVHARINEILGKRKNKHPLEYRNAGSIFKNPNGGIPAGRIIDELGLKGIQIGSARISEKHGNFIVNLGNAKASDIIALIDMIKAKVNKERGIMLQTEVMIVGEDG
ncbi:MAG: UDP-N-acetylmuramate dehydrogenase [Syntrophales bacterium LBB04]|nr:UDP-N-acetylmuramate dehydrogenase [Syntrophales bacterium LBB04]